MYGMAISCYREVRTGQAYHLPCTATEGRLNESLACAPPSTILILAHGSVFGPFPVSRLNIIVVQAVAHPEKLHSNGF